MDNQEQTQSIPNTSNMNGKTVGIIAYLTIIGLIIAFIMNKDEKDAYASYHIRQSMGIMATALAFMVIGMIPILGWIVSFLGSILLIILWIVGLINAVNHKEKPVPILGNKYNEWFKGI